MSTLIHSFPHQFQPTLWTDLVVLDTLSLKKDPFHKGYYLELFRFLIEKNELDDFTMVLIVEIWSYEGVHQVLEKAINKSKIKNNMTIGLYEYHKQNSYYSHDIVPTIHFYT